MKKHVKIPRRRLSGALAVLGLLSIATATASAIRSSSAKADFKREHPCPATGPGVARAEAM